MANKLFVVRRRTEDCGDFEWEEDNEMLQTVGIPWSQKTVIKDSTNDQQKIVESTIKQTLSVPLPAAQNFNLKVILVNNWKYEHVNYMRL